MGRNPAVGRQGPRFYAAAIPAEAEAKDLEVTQIRSGIGQPETMRRTLRAIGLRHHQHSVRVRNTAALRGMLYKVRHLVRVQKAGAK
jgi:large subunit ribosomal protein L30